MSSRFSTFRHIETAFVFIEYALSIGALQLLPEGRVLKSGRKSPYFFNSALFNTGKRLSHLTEAYVDTIVDEIQMQGFAFDVLFGPAYKGITLASNVAEALWTHLEMEVQCVYNRKEVKDHGEGGLIVGGDITGKRVLIIDDVITSGESKDEAIKIIRQAGGIPVGCVIAFDREERAQNSNLSAAQEFTIQHDIPLFAAATFTYLHMVLSDYMEQPSTDEYDPEFYRTMWRLCMEYKDMYGVE